MFTKMARRVVTAGVAGVAVLAMGASSASAHFCYFTEPNIKAQLGRAGSNGFISFGDLATLITGVCPAGAEVFADAAGVTTDTLINAHGLMAGGALRSGKDVKPISHLDIAAIEAVAEDAFAACV